MKNQTIQASILFISVTLLTSCSSTFKYKTPESIESKMARYQTKQDYLGNTPKFPVMNIDQDNFQSISNKRAPASVDTGHDNPKQPNEINTNNYKNTYFMLLLSQYETLAQMTGPETKKINFCPGFHSTIVESHLKKATNNSSQSSIGINFSLNTNIWNEEYLALFPELMLPLSLNKNSETVADWIKKKNIDDLNLVSSVLREAISTHSSKLYKELEFLCENGASSNYYKFENMLTDINQRKSFPPTSKNTSVLLKTTVFSNMILINSLQYQKNNRSVASTMDAGNYKEVMIDQLNLNWIKTYMREMNKRK